jgi:four helix bundle protein
MQRFTELKVWQRSHLLALRIYVLTEGFPTSEQYSLVSQMRRAAVSTPTNIAEGSKRTWGRDYSRFLNIAQGSATELESLLLFSRDLGLLSVEKTAPLLAEVETVCGMLERLRQRVDRDALAPAATASRRPRSAPSTLNAQPSTRPHVDSAERVA